MASNFLCALSLISCLLFLTFFSQTSYVNSVPLRSGTSEKVPVGLYYQSIGSSTFFTNALPVISKKGLFSIIDLHLSPWGNSKILNNETFTFSCQGGELECYINTIEACAIYTWPDVDKHFRFINCVESLVPALDEISGESLLANDKTTEWERCYSILKLDRKPIDECYNSGLGKKLERKYAEETAALTPPHKFTPWIVVAGKPIEEDFFNLAKYVCEAYKGSSPPEACKDLPIINSESNESKKVHVSYKAKAVKVYSIKDSKSISGSQ